MPNKYIVTLQLEVDNLELAQEIRRTLQAGSPRGSVSVSLWDADGLCMGLIASGSAIRPAKVPHPLVPGQPVVPLNAAVKRALASGKIGPLFLHDEIRFTGGVFNAAGFAYPETCEATQMLKPYTWEEIQAATLRHNTAEKHIGEDEPTVPFAVTPEAEAKWAELRAADASKPSCNGFFDDGITDGNLTACRPGNGCMHRFCPCK